MLDLQNKHRFFNQTVHIVRRTLSGIKRRPWLHLLSTATLAAAFLSFAATLTAATNINALIDKLANTAAISVYLHEGTSDTELKKLQLAVSQIRGIEKVEAITQQQAYYNFTKEFSQYSAIGENLPKNAFPASLDIHLKPSLSNDTKARHVLAKRLSKVAMIEDIEIYDDWFKRLGAVSTMGRLSAWGLGLLALVVAILVVAATIRQGVSARKKEIVVMRFVGATQGYVRLPFLLQGAFESMLAMLIAIFALHLLMNQIDTIIGDILPLIGGSRLIRLTFSSMVYLVTGGLAAGLIGAKLSLRKLEEA